MSSVVDNQPLTKALCLLTGPYGMLLKIKYKENRNMQYFFQGGQRVPVQYNLVERVWFTGMLAPTSKVFEAYYHDSFLLFGTPQEIFTAVKHLEKHFAGLKT